MKNTFMIDGRIGANGAEVRQTKDGKPYVKFSIANNSNPKQETPEWFDVICYDSNVINNLTEYLTKGTHVMIIGTFKASVNVDRNGKVWLNQTVTTAGSGTGIVTSGTTSTTVGLGIVIEDAVLPV